MPFTTTYAIQVDHLIYEAMRDGTPFTLVTAMREVYGVRNAHVLRLTGDDATWTTVVYQAGSSVEVTYQPTGRTVRRRLTRRAWGEEMARMQRAYEMREANRRAEQARRDALAEALPWALMNEARGWLADCGMGGAWAGTRAQVAAAVDRSYEGGLAAFLADTRVLVAS